MNREADLGNGATAQVLLTTGWESARIAAVPSLVMVLAVVVALTPVAPRGCSTSSSGVSGSS
ncbi:hypothetical protein ABC795_03995 [Blastococcus sp. HT6-30]|uniref:hypothetical protein n=1 Tax=Blastococcus sp. HT6-30 TaxID=3144843 RepID=UPI00321C0E5B